MSDESISDLQYLTEFVVYTRLLTMPSNPDNANYASNTFNELEVNSFLKATKLLSKGLHLEQLVQKIMEIVIEHAGAQKGYLLLNKDGNFYLEAKKTTETFTRIQEAISINEIEQNSIDLSGQIVRYVTRIQSGVFLDNSKNDERFFSDPYLLQQNPKSILCQPIIHNQNILGIIYLENNCISGTFTYKSLEIIHLLSTHAALSLENARLQENLNTVVELFNKRTTSKPSSQERNHLTAKEEGSHHLIPFEKIIYISSHTNTTIIHTLKKDFSSSKKLKQLISNIPKEQFMRVHKSFVVNISWIARIEYYIGGTYIAHLKDQDESQ
ncbi:MAG: LytTR family transcriptional regulator DNA-binding domain-containing protein, partial [Spirochaetota bacterium]